MFHSTEDRLQKRNQRRKKPLEYHKKVIKRDGTEGWQGCKDLPRSAIYPRRFCAAIFSAWQVFLEPAACD